MNCGQCKQHVECVTNYQCYKQFPPCASELAEPKADSLQQLKAEILALRRDGVVADDMYWIGWNMAIERATGVLKLSAV